MTGKRRCPVCRHFFTLSHGERLPAHDRLGNFTLTVQTSAWCEGSRRTIDEALAMTATREPPRLRTLDRGEVVPVVDAQLEALAGHRVELDKPVELELDDRAPAREDA